MKKNLDPRLIPELNIGLLGHVDSGKTTLVQAISGKWTDTHTEEMKRGITIRIGYADATIYKCKKCDSFLTSPKCQKCFEDSEPVRTVSFVDLPGHNTLMATVLSGASLIDCALLVIAADEPCPQPQTREHLMALEIVGIKNVIIVQNKLDLVTEAEAKKNYEEIKRFIRGTTIENADIVPVSALQRAGISFLIDLFRKIPTPERDPKADPIMLTARSFDVNKPGTKIEKIVGGVIGGSLIQGELCIGDEIEIQPGVGSKGLLTKISGLQKASINLTKVRPGGLVGVATTLDPALTKADALAGSVVGLPGRIPKAMSKIAVCPNLFEHVVGTAEKLPVSKIVQGELIMLTCGVGRAVGKVISTKRERVELELSSPICVLPDAKIALSRLVSNRWRLIGWGSVVE
jgi:translation initiation factor 2 subunit 3